MEDDEATPLEGEEILGAIPPEPADASVSEASKSPDPAEGGESAAEAVAGPPSVVDPPIELTFQPAAYEVTDEVIDVVIEGEHADVQVEHVEMQVDQVKVLVEHIDVHAEATNEQADMHVDEMVNELRDEIKEEIATVSDHVEKEEDEWEREAEISARLQVRLREELDKAVGEALEAKKAADAENAAAVLQKTIADEISAASDRMAALLKVHHIRSHAHFHEELHGRAATFACVYDTRKGEPLIKYGNGKTKCNLYSITKSLSALVIIDDHLRGTLPIGMDSLDDDISIIVEAFFCERRLDMDNPPPPPDTFTGLSLAMLMNHSAGVDEIPLTAENVIKLVVKEKNTQNIIGRFLNHYNPKASFKYSPVLGYAMVGAIYEILKEGGTCLKDECEARFLKGVWPRNTWHWREDEGEDICKHSFAFSEVFTTGENMVELGIALLYRHRPLLDYILDENKPHPHYIKYAQSGGSSSYSARDGHHESHNPHNPHAIEYAYSEGWWILKRSPSRRYLVGIGWLGQYLMIGVDDGIVAVRQHEFGKIATDADAREQARKKKNVIIPNYHECFPMHVISFLDAIAD